jgi:hypothetical protein
MTFFKFSYDPKCLQIILKIGLLRSVIFSPFILLNIFASKAEQKSQGRRQNLKRPYKNFSLVI